MAVLDAFMEPIILLLLLYLGLRNNFLVAVLIEVAVANAGQATSTYG
jgi:hypothetical protein